MLKILTIIFILLPIFSLAAEDKNGVQIVEATKAERKDLISEVNLIGILSSRQETTFIAKYDGILTKINFRDGDLVKKGEIIAEMENEELYNAHKLSAASEAIAHDQFERALKLYKQGYLNKDNLAEKEQQWHVEKQNLNKAKKALENSYLRAPFDGKLGVFKVKQGSFVKSGTEIVTFFNPYLLQIDLNIPENLASQIQAGSQAQALGEKLKIDSIERIVSNKTRMVDAKIYLPDSLILHNNIIGSIVEVKVTVKSKINALVVPKKTLFLEANKPHILKINNNKAELSEVKVGDSNDELVEILSGINEGDQIILFGQNHIKNGTPVEVRNP